MLLLNALPDHGRPLYAADAALFGEAAAREVAAHLARRADHAPTPLLRLPGLAARIGVGAVAVKDEGRRLGLGSFKALGGAYAVSRAARDHVAAKLGRAVEARELEAGPGRNVLADFVVCCATDGNHGRSVAQGARMLGARCVVFVHAGVSEARADAIASFGAEIARVAGSYDDSVEEAARVAAREGWTVASDTAWPGYERIPGYVMEGYTAIVDEALAALDAPPTHMFLQAGVGGFAAAVAGRFAARLGEARPKVVVVEPARAACLLASAMAGAALRIPHGEPTVMAMLECREPSLSAWRILSRLADAFMSVEEEESPAAMLRLARPAPGDPAIVAGESGCVGLAGLLNIARDDAARAALGLDAASRVLLVNTEGATDPQLYRDLTGLDPATVA
jgi:diaminopropionate ammonia-lyase